MKRTKWHRIVAAAISLCMVMTLLPMSALAEDADGNSNSVTVDVGRTETITVDGSYEADSITVKNENIATAEVTGVATIPGAATADAADSITDGQSYAISDGSGNYLSLDSGNNVTNVTDPATATLWTITVPQTSYYYITAEVNGTTYYLTYSSGSVGVATSTWYWYFDSSYGFCTDSSRTYYYLYCNDGNWQFNSGSAASSNLAQPYTITTEADTYTTTITVTGVAAGTTTLTVGDSVYTIEVTEPEDDPDISAATKRETVSLTVGETSETYTVSGKDVSGSDSYKSFVTVNVDPSAASDSEAGLTSGMALVIGDGNGNYLKREGEKIVSVNSAENATVWTVGTQRSTVNGQVVATYYYLEDVEEYFLCSRYGTGTGAGQYNYELNVTNNPASKNFRRWEYSAGNGFSYSGYSLTYTGTGGWSLENNGASGAAAYSVTSTVTITGVSEGNTIVTVGDTTYSITVKAGSIDTSNPASQTGKPTDGMTTGQPFISNTTGGSQYFRIPAIVTLDNGTLVAAADARWDTTADGGGLDTIVARSSDGGANWNYIFANYLGDNGNEHNGASTAFIDPALATDGETVYMVVDLFPAGYALNGANDQPAVGDIGFTTAGDLKLKKSDETSYDYYLRDGKIYGSDDTAVEGYTVDEYFNIFGTDGTNSNLFFADSPYLVYPTNYLYLTSSTDAGKTWSVPTLINVKNASEQTYLVGPGGGTVTSTGRIIFPCYTYTGADGNTSVIYSDDKGKTWTRSGAVTEQTSEATVSEVTVNGTNYLYMFTRHGGYYVSNDDGETWGAQQSVSDISYDTGCELSTLTYSKTIDGCPAIILSAPTNGRAAGKLFVGLVQSDGSINWKYTYSVNGSGTYQYSDLTELSDGSIGLLYEDGSGSITYTTLSIETITDGAVIDGKVALTVPLYGTRTETMTNPPVATDLETLTPSDVVSVAVNETSVTYTGLKEGTASYTSGSITYTITVEAENVVEVPLEVGGTYETAVETSQIAMNTESSIATAEIQTEDNSFSVTGAQGNLGTTSAYNGGLVPMSNALYRFTKSGENSYTVSAKTSDGTTVYLSPSVNGIGYPSSTTQKTIEVSTGSAENSFYLNDGTSYLHFYRNNNICFDRVSTTTGYEAACSFLLFRPATDSEDTTNSAISGYVQITDTKDIEDGGYYLIVAQVGTTYYALYPSTDTSNKYTHVVKVNSEVESATETIEDIAYTLTITGVAAGTTDVAVDGVIYRVTVTDTRKVVEIELGFGEDIRYIVESGATITGEPDSGIAAADITTKQNSAAVTNGAMGNLGTDANYNGTEVPLSNALYLFTQDGDGYIVSNHQTNDTVYLNIGTVGYPSQTTSDTLTFSKGFLDNSFYIHSADNNSYLHFYRDGNNYFSRVNGTSGYQAACSFLLFRPGESGKATNSVEIPGYVQVTSLDEIQDGGFYLIVAEYKGDYYALYPSTSTSDKYAHVVKINSTTNSDTATVGPVPTTRLKITAQNTAGTTDVAVGNVIYRVTVRDNTGDVYIRLERGDSVSYKVDSGVTAVTSNSDPSIADAEIVSRSNAATVTDGAKGTVGTAETEVSLSDALYLFTANGDGFAVSAPVKYASGNNTVYLSTGTVGVPNSETSGTVVFSESLMYAYNFYIQQNGYYLTFDRNGSNVFDHTTTPNSTTALKTACSFLLFRPAASGETGTTIPGYVQLKTLDEIQDGGVYLIVAEYNGGYYALYPSDTSTPANHVATVNTGSTDNGTVTVTRRDTTQLTITAGDTEGTTVVEAGGVRYHVTVTKTAEERLEVDVELKAGESYPTEVLEAVSPRVTVKDPDIVSTSVTDESFDITYWDGVGQLASSATDYEYGGSTTNLNAALYTFVRNSNGTWSIYAKTSNNDTVYLNLARAYPNLAADCQIALIDNADFTFGFFSSVDNQYLTFQNGHFDRISDGNAASNFRLCRPITENDMADEYTPIPEIPGYALVQSEDDLVNGNKYLIVTDDLQYALYPSTSTDGYAYHTVKIKGEEEVRKVTETVNQHKLTITGLYPGRTDVVFGGVTYHVTVTIENYGTVTVTVPLYGTKTVTATGETYAQALKENLDSTYVSVNVGKTDTDGTTEFTLRGLKEGLTSYEFTGNSDYSYSVKYIVNVVPTKIVPVSVSANGTKTINVVNADSDMQGIRSVKVNEPESIGEVGNKATTEPYTDAGGIAQVTLTDESDVTDYHDVLGSRSGAANDYSYTGGESVWLSSARYTFTLNANGTGYTVSNTTPDGETVYLYLRSQRTGSPNTTASGNRVTLSRVDGADAGTFRIISYSNDNDYDGYLYFTAEAGFDQWKTGSLPSNTEYINFQIYRLVREGEEESAIPGYYQITSTDEIESGHKYLIVAERGGEYYALYPSTSTTDRTDHVVKIDTSAKKAVDDKVDTTYSYTLEITGQKSGTTDYMVGNTIYRITVDPVATVTIDGNVDGMTYYSTLESALTYAEEHRGTTSTVVALLTDLTNEASASVSAGVTLDLAGHNLTFSEKLVVFGGLLDSVADAADNSTIGGILKVPETGFAYMGDQAGEGVLPIYDSTAGGYRLYSYRFYGVGKLDKTPSSVRFCFRLVFNNRYAWDLLANENSGVTFYLETTVGESVATFEFPHDVINTIQDLVITQNKDQESVYIYVRVIGLENFSGQTVYAKPKLAAGGLYTDTATDPNNKMYYEIPAAE